MLQIEKTYDSWTSERIARHILYWSAWLLFYVITNSSYHDKPSVFGWFTLELIVMCVKLPFAYFVIYFLVPNYLLTKRYQQFFIVFFIAATIGGLANWTQYYYWLNPYFFDMVSKGFWCPKIAYKVLDLIYISSIPTVFKLYQRQAMQEKRATQLVEQKLGAELKLLKNQLHPHFLFNTLNNLYSMVLTKHPNAADVVLRLSDMMSYMLYDCEKKWIDLEKEIDNLQNYIELEKIRYGKRLDISLETGGDVKGKVIAPLLLLPFLENAFKHGSEKSLATSWVRINLWVKEQELTFLIENSLSEVSQSEAIPLMQSGVGLTNVRKRLELLYPEKHALEIVHEDTFFVKLKLVL